MVAHYWAQRKFLYKSLLVMVVLSKNSLRTQIIALLAVHWPKSRVTHNRSPKKCEDAVPGNLYRIWTPVKSPSQYTRGRNLSGSISFPTSAYRLNPKTIGSTLPMARTVKCTLATAKSLKYSFGQHPAPAEYITPSNFKLRWVAKVRLETSHLANLQYNLSAATQLSLLLNNRFNLI